jgi:hypothetical protein
MNTMRSLCRLRAAGSLVGILALAGTAGAEALPDVSWRKILAPTHGAFNRDEPNPIGVAFSIDGSANPVKVIWAVTSGETVVASDQKLVTTSQSGDNTFFIIELPPMPPGDYVLDMTADPEDQIVEKDERNNRIRLSFQIPNGRPVILTCRGTDGKEWKIQRVELSTASGLPYPDRRGTRPDTARSSEYEIGVSGVVPGDYMGIVFAPSVNRQPVLIASGSFQMPDPPIEMKVSWPRATPYIQGKPKLKGEIPTGAGGESGAPIWKANANVQLQASVTNPTDRTADVQWLLRFIPKDDSFEMVAHDTLLTLGALSTETLTVTGRIPMEEGNFLLQAEVRVPWPSGFEDLSNEDRVASAVIPIGWVEVQR